MRPPRSPGALVFPTPAFAGAGSAGTLSRYQNIFQEPPAKCEKHSHIFPFGSRFHIYYASLLYLDIGKMICEKQKELGWGKSIITTMADDLQKEFPGQTGFSARNLRLMAMFYSEYKDDTFWQPLAAKISFSHNIMILTNCQSKPERQFYIEAVNKFDWSKRVLEHQIENKTYEKYLLGQTNYDQLAPEKFQNQRTLAIKDHYTFDFLELSEKHSERELEEGLLRNMQQFLLELGGDFSFMGSQYKITVGINASVPPTYMVKMRPLHSPGAIVIPSNGLPRLQSAPCKRAISLTSADHRPPTADRFFYLLFSILRLRMHLYNK